MRPALTASKVTSLFFTSVLFLTSFNVIGADTRHHRVTNPAGTLQSADPLEFTQLEVGEWLVGGAILKRTFASVSASVEARGLDFPNSPYTAWWVVFNNPAACTGGAAELTCPPTRSRERLPLQRLTAKALS